MDNIITLSKYNSLSPDDFYEIYIPNVLWILPRDIKFWYTSFLRDIDGMDSEVVLSSMEEYFENFYRLLYKEKHHEHEKKILKIILDAAIDVYDMCCENRGVVQIVNKIDK